MRWLVLNLAALRGVLRCGQLPADQSSKRGFRGLAVPPTCRKHPQYQVMKAGFSLKPSPDWEADLLTPPLPLLCQWDDELTARCPERTAPRPARYLQTLSRSHGRRSRVGCCWDRSQPCRGLTLLERSWQRQLF